MKGSTQSTTIRCRLMTPSFLLRLCSSRDKSQARYLQPSTYHYYYFWYNFFAFVIIFGWLENIF
ncbi:MAG: hypothetical protein K6253_01430 [Candidatus Liberibacter asiaticus]|nr:hypothetical protein [Candidatus Liberibacter asiaticus]